MSSVAGAEGREQSHATAAGTSAAETRPRRQRDAAFRGDWSGPGSTAAGGEQVGQLRFSVSGGGNALNVRLEVIC